MGEAFVGFQSYALDQAKRGIILAVCFEERRGQRARALRAAPGNGVEAQAYRQLRRQLARQGQQLSAASRTS